jgi:phosphoribosyl-ATP pyrophosphohydrolase/phosphoribosyl-AMP cyclohydrolase
MTPPSTDRRIRGEGDLDELVFDERGLLPIVVQDALTGSLLMLAWGSRGSLEATLASGFMHFWSRSRGALWKKGETSGNAQALVSLHSDCDGDTVLALVRPAGPACHTGEITCFGFESTPSSVLDELWDVIELRDRERPDGSYTTRLLGDENLRLKKLGEEVAELISALARKDAAAGAEAADLLYHLLVALKGARIDWTDVKRELERRRG